MRVQERTHPLPQDLHGAADRGRPRGSGLILTWGGRLAPLRLQRPPQGVDRLPADPFGELRFQPFKDDAGLAVRAFPFPGTPDQALPGGGGVGNLFEQSGGDQAVHGLVCGLPGHAHAPRQLRDRGALVVQYGEELRLRRGDRRGAARFHGRQQPFFEPAPGVTEQLGEVAVGGLHVFLTATGDGGRARLRVAHRHFPCQAT